MPRPDAHPSPDDLRAFALGLLPAGEAAAVEAHLSDCPACARLLDDLPADPFLAALRTARSGSTAATPTGSAVPLHPRPSEGPPPELVDHPRYTLGELLGRGGMGTVFRAEHALMGRPVALKVIAPRLLEHPGAADRFR
ncbi:MAG: zf-HC2 domain-containing protein, partial [Gemmataceae bacterium]|nr:zf-HC2 domain-containing protein [Gemmataceae bacterium]